MLESVEVFPRSQISFLHQVLRPVLVRHLSGQTINGSSARYRSLFELFCSFSPGSQHQTNWLLLNYELKQKKILFPRALQKSLNEYGLDAKVIRVCDNSHHFMAVSTPKSIPGICPRNRRSAFANIPAFPKLKAFCLITSPARCLTKFILVSPASTY